MNKDEMMEKIQDEDFIIRVRPFSDDNGEWSGEKNGRASCRERV